MLYQKKIRRKKQMAHITAVWVIAMVCLGALVVAQVEPPREQPVVLGSGGGTVSGHVDDQHEMKGAIQTLTFKKDTTITDALGVLALRYKKNIVPTPRVEGFTTVTNLYNVTFEEALQAIIGTNRYEIQGNFIMVYTPDEYEQIKADKRRMEYKVFTLYYLNATEAEKMIKAVLSPDGTVATSSQAETKLPGGGDSISDESGGDTLAYQDTIVVQDYPEKIQQVEELLSKLDMRPQQVLIEATILSANLTEGLELGVDLNLAGGTVITGTAATQDYITGDTVDRGTTGTNPIAQVAGWAQGGNPIEVAGFAQTGGSGLRLGIRSGDISLFITALEQVTDVTVLANPKILAVNKQVGQVYIGRKLGYRESDIETAAGGTQQGSVKWLETGTKLIFRPYIGSDGYIRMDIHPKDSVGELNAENVPDETSAELRTNIIVKDGETIVIGGLFRDVVNSTRSQVPLLGDVPFLGEAFKGTSEAVTRQEVIVLLTPHVINNPAELNGDERVADVQRKRFGARERLKWIGIGSLAEDSYNKAAGLYAEGDSRAALEELNWTLHLRPTYLEAIRLRERIVQYRGGAGDDVIERIMIQAIEKENSEKWLRF